MLTRFVQPSIAFVRFKVTPLQALFGLLVADLSFMLMHVLHTNNVSIFYYWRFELMNDRGFASNFLYLQEVAIAVIAFVLFLYYRRLFVFAVLGAMFTYIYLDDAFLLHEHTGLLLAQGLGLPAVGGMRPRDLGEVVLFLAFGVIFSSLFVIAYLRGGRDERPIAIVLFVLLGALAFCGVGFDAMHAALKNPALTTLFDILEDGGEMIVISVFLWYGLRLLRIEQRKAGIIA